MDEADSPESDQPASTGLERKEIVGILLAVLAAGITAAALAALVLIPGWPLAGQPEGAPFPDWVPAMVPMLFVIFIVPGMVYGISVGTIRSDKDIAKMLGQTMSSMGPYIVLAFFAGQFTAWFAHSNLGAILAITGVEFLQQFDIPLWMYVLAIILLVGFLNMFIGSASGKWALIAPVFVPLFMGPLTGGQGISPELTQAAYRVGDSVTNTIAPLNPYVIIILVFMRKYAPQSGLGSLISLMLPYTLWFGIVWSLMLLTWVLLGIPLGPDNAPLFLEHAEPAM